MYDTRLIRVHIVGLRTFGCWTVLSDIGQLRANNNCSSVTNTGDLRAQIGILSGNDYENDILFI